MEKCFLAHLKPLWLVLGLYVMEKTMMVNMPLDHYGPLIQGFDDLTF